MQIQQFQKGKVLDENDLLKNYQQYRSFWEKRNDKKLSIHLFLDSAIFLRLEN